MTAMITLATATLSFIILSLAVIRAVTPPLTLKILWAISVVAIILLAPIVLGPPPLG